MAYYINCQKDTEPKGNTMKPLKKANQKNVEIDRCSYHYDQYRDLEKISGVFNLKDAGFDEDDQLRVSLAHVKDLKIALHEGYYVNKAIMNTGEEIFVIL